MTKLDWHDVCESEHCRHIPLFICYTTHICIGSWESVVIFFFERSICIACYNRPIIMLCYSKLDDFEWHSHINITCYLMFFTDAAAATHIEKSGLTVKSDLISLSFRTPEIKKNVSKNSWWISRKQKKNSSRIWSKKLIWIPKENPHKKCAQNVLHISV